ncbi:MAG: peptide ABC transporter substrate-binding protein [Alicyclobacillus sp.]|nr:peptide ABC transporter substrate-binding protein [Alicyclobacillus sp.]
MFNNRLSRSSFRKLAFSADYEDYERFDRQQAGIAPRRGKRAAAGLLAGVSAVSLLAAAAPAAFASAQDKTTFAMDYLDDGHGFDPAVFSYEMYLDGMGIFEGLVHMGPNGRPVPGIAKSWKVSPDGKTWTFYLRNAKFSNGDPVTADDFVYSIKRAVDPKTAPREQGSPVVINDLPILNAQDIRLGNLPINALGVKALNAQTLQIRLSRKDPNFLQHLLLPSSSFMVPVDEHVVPNMTPADWSNPAKIVSDGPYMLAQYTPKVSAKLVPNPYYYGKVKLKEIDLIYSNTNQLLAYKSGSVDMAQLGPQDVAAVEKDPSLKPNLHWWPASAQYSLEVLPSQNTLLRDNQDVRKAFELAVDKNTICKAVLQGAGTPAVEYFSPTWLDPWIKRYAVGYDPKQAQELLAKAGYPHGKNFPTVVLLTTGVDPVAQAVQQMWEKTLGVKVNLVSDEWGAFVTALQQQLPGNEVGFYVWSTNSKYPDLMLPQSVQQWLGVNTSAIRGYASPQGYQQWMSINNDKSLDPAKAAKMKVRAMWDSFPPDVKQYLQLGVRAFETNNAKLMEEFYGLRAQRVYDIPVYTPLNPVLLRPDVHGYQVDDFLDVTPPYWLNAITRK